MKLGLFKQKVCWVPTWRAWLCLGVLMSALGFGVTKCLHPFLAVSAPVGGDVLVIEGWLPDYAVERAVELAREQGYEKFVVTGVDIEKGSHLTIQTNYAQISGSALRHLGVPESRIVELPSHNVHKNRTYTTALAVREWAGEQGNIKKLDVFTLGPHARRTRLLYQIAFGGSCEIGVISTANEDYDANHWWLTSDGFRTTAGELLAYAYVRILFHA